MDPMKASVRNRKESLLHVRLQVVINLVDRHRHQRILDNELIILVSLPLPYFMQGLDSNAPCEMSVQLQRIPSVNPALYANRADMCERYSLSQLRVITLFVSQ